MNDHPALQYRITPRLPSAHLFEVQCTVAHPDPAGQRVSLPAWTPGSYLIRDFARHVVRLSASSRERPVSVSKLDKDTWRCAPCEGPLVIRCEVYAWDRSVRGAHLDDTHGFFNGTSVFLMVHGQTDRACRVEILPPAGDAVRRWRVGTAMTRDGAAPYGFGTYRADNYEELADHPVEMGEFALATFEAGGVPHDIVLTGRHHADLDRLRADLHTLCSHHIGFFGAPPPMDRYVFLITAVGEGYGGLEHRASTSLLCSRNDLPRPREKGVSDGYRTFLGLASHEYFHTWNVKRITPHVFRPYDLEREAYTRLLWAFEGITSYYDTLALVRSGLISPESYLDLLGQTITRLLRSGGRLKQTLEESSFDAWIKFYKPDENTPNAVVSYYTKGALVALALDLTIRRDTRGARSLDDVMRALWERHGKTRVGVPEDGVERLAHEVSGLDLRLFFDRALRSTDELALDELLSHFGIRSTLRPAESATDKGGKPAGKPESALAERPVLGVRLGEDGHEAALTHVLEGGAAQMAGLAAGDLIVAVDGIRATRANLDALIGRLTVGATIRLHAFRRDELMEFTATLQPPPADTCVLALRGDVDDATRARLEAWVRGGPAASW
ncbi:MAG: M61 family metallopeptidase [Nitrospirae bacterium]|nr:M61 family metallopeptidase [Nitrospirota bacterium]